MAESNVASKLELADHISSDFGDVWPSLDYLLPLTATIVDRVVVVQRWKWSLLVLAIFPAAILITMLSIVLMFSGWVIFFLGLFAGGMVVAIMLLEFHLRWRGTLCMLSNDGCPSVSFPRAQRLVLLDSVSSIDLVWVKATPNTYIRRVGVVIVHGTETESRKLLSIPVFLSYNKKECQKALASIQEVLVTKPQTPA